MPSASILITTSKNSLANDLCERLNALGYKAFVASNEDISRQIQEMKPDLVVSDVQPQAGGQIETGQENLVAERELQRLMERVDILLQVASQINTELELETALSIICDATTRIMKSNGASILCKDSRQKVFQSAAVAGDARLVEEYKETKFEVLVNEFQSLFTATDSAELLIAATEYPDPRFAQFFRKFDIQTVVLAPLYQNDDLIGCFALFFSAVMTNLHADERKWIEWLAVQAEIAISNASSFKQVRASRERQQLLTRKLVEVQENERRSLARELHDEIGQMLTGLQFTIKWLMTNSNEEQKTRLEQVQIIISAIISQIRELSINLRPSLLDDLGLLPTLEWYLNRYEATTGVQVQFEHQNLNQRFNTELETTAFRIAQEALTNIARYAESETAFIKIRVLDSVMQIEIVDTGKGFDLAGLSRKESVGIEGMRERAYAIGGLLDIDSQLGQGTSVRASLPVSGRMERRAHERDHSSG